MKNNSELQKDVQNAIRWEPLLHAAEIGVTVQDGIVTLTGEVDNYLKKIEAEHAAKRVAGVLAIIENIDVKFKSSFTKTNLEIANEVLIALKTNWAVPKDKIDVKVEDGWVTLDGEVHWNYQREAAKSAVHYLDGIKGISNNIKIKTASSDTIEKKDVENALNRSWLTGLKNIEVAVSGSTVTLSGMVDSWYQKDEASRIAWNTPGIWYVNNELIIEDIYALVD